MNENEFELFCVNKVSNPRTAKNYVDSLKKDIYLLNNTDLHNLNVFEIDNVNNFNRLKERITSDSNYNFSKTNEPDKYKNSANKYHGRFNSALNMYLDFLINKTALKKSFIMITREKYKSWLKKRVCLLKGDVIKYGHRSTSNYVLGVTKELTKLKFVEEDFNVFGRVWNVEDFFRWFEKMKQKNISEYTKENKNSQEQSVNFGLKVFAELLVLEFYKGNYVESKNYIIKCDEIIYGRMPSKKGKRLIDFFEENYKVYNNLSTKVQEDNNVNTYNEKQTGAYNKIYFGAPGTGKSYSLNKIYSESEYNIERTLFHPEYTYNDFVGYLVPKVIEQQINYVYHEGAFTKVLKDAINNPNEKFVLIIEEINRGNAAAIFGDIFQLLDRDNNGESEYPIYNRQIIDQIDELEEKVYIPSNMWIIATANTSDQNSFVMDTAFLRRWEMSRVEINFNQRGIENWKFEEGFLPCETWKEFGETINSFLEKHTEELMSEDKLLGQWFIKEKDLEKENFINKVFRYLWEDVVKLDRQILFDSGVKSFNDLCKKLNSNKEVFNAEVLESFKTNETTENVD